MLLGQGSFQIVPILVTLPKKQQPLLPTRLQKLKINHLQQLKRPRKLRESQRWRKTVIIHYRCIRISSTNVGFFLIHLVCMCCILNCLVRQLFISSFSCINRFTWRNCAANGMIWSFPYFVKSESAVQNLYSSKCFSLHINQ